MTSKKGQIGGSTSFGTPGTIETPGALRSPPVASGEPRRLLSSSPLQSSSGECRFRRRTPMRKSLIAITPILAALAMATPSEAKPRPTVDSSDICWGGASSDKGCGGLICWCCYDEGCWICNKDTYDCVWDGSYRAGSRPGEPYNVPPPAGVKPPWSEIPAPKKP